MATYHFPKILGLIVIFFSLAIEANKPFTTMQCESSVTGIHNHRTVLVCEYESQPGQKCHSNWSYQAVHSNQIENLCTEKKANAWKQRRCSTDLNTTLLIIEETEISDEGKYHILLDCGRGGYKKAKINLLVEAPYTVPQVTKSDRGDEKGLSCTTLGYPLAKLQWQIENGINLTANYSSLRREDKLYNLTTHLSVVGELCSINYICSVCIENACKSAKLDCSKTEKNVQLSKQKRRTPGVYLSLGFIMIIFTLLAITLLFDWSHQIPRASPTDLDLMCEH
ncbi:uncharacterized protein LOC119953205 isoform X2 [Scyliorhinus canicula]|uniref:uncharacterized protein LOC119953205 isoform X2 n=1 Tax=Scyliorhinus canicula TaxID=7830 RepID=UPI0018F3FF9F|nr:uncharacterized protein LOC119953205 isoform X2 [Scyliorhinus canicula]